MSVCAISMVKSEHLGWLFLEQQKARRARCRKRFDFWATVAGQMEIIPDAEKLQAQRMTKRSVNGFSHAQMDDSRPGTARRPEILHKQATTFEDKVTERIDLLSESLSELLLPRPPIRPSVRPHDD